METNREIVLRGEAELVNHERKAWEALARYKFWMFGYHAAQCVLLAQVLGIRGQKPFGELVEMARKVVHRERR